MENQILTLLQQMKGSLEKIEGRLDSIEGRLDNIEGRLEKIEGRLDKVEGRLDKVEGRLDKVEGTLKEHSETLKEHGRILSALRTGQEYNKAELNEMKLQNAKEFGEIKEHLKNQEDSIEILKEETWNNKKNILRVQKTLGLS